MLLPPPNPPGEVAQILPLKDPHPHFPHEVHLQRLGLPPPPLSGGRPFHQSVFDQVVHNFGGQGDAGDVGPDDAVDRGGDPLGGVLRAVFHLGGGLGFQLAVEIPDEPVSLPLEPLEPLEFAGDGLPIPG